MIYVLVGVTAQKSFVKKSHISVPFQDVKWENSSIEELLSLASSQSMFGGIQTYVLAGALNSERQDEFLDIAKELADSNNVFIFEEEKLLKGPTTVLEKAGAEITVEKRPAGKERGFDPFGLTFALGAKDRKKLWLALVQAFSAGEKAEAVAGLLVWKARQMNDANLSRKLTFMYHDAHRGMGSLELLLERFALTL